MIRAIVRPVEKTDVAASTMPEKESVLRITDSNLQSVIDAAKPGETLVIPEGTYTKPITITKSLVLKGEKCLFQVTADEPAIFINTSGGKVSIEGVTIKWQLASSDNHEFPFAVAVKGHRRRDQELYFLST